MTARERIVFSPPRESAATVDGVDFRYGILGSLIDDLNADVVALMTAPATAR